MRSWRCRYIAVTLPLHCRYIAVTLRVSTASHHALREGEAQEEATDEALRTGDTWRGGVMVKRR